MRQQHSVGDVCSFEGCGQSVRAKGLCRGHYGQQWKGQPLRPLKRRHTLKDRFWSMVNKSGAMGPHVGTPCWEWVGARVGSGYGRIKQEDRIAAAHRVSWEIHNGPIPDGMLVCHHCDNPSCVRPDHLFLGTQVDNIRDMLNKGRGASQLRPERLPRGERHYAATLTEEDVLSIRAEYAQGGAFIRALARRYGVNPTTIKCLLTRKTWKHLP